MSRPYLICYACQTPIPTGEEVQRLGEPHHADCPKRIQEGLP